MCHVGAGTEQPAQLPPHFKAPGTENAAPAIRQPPGTTGAAIAAPTIAQASPMCTDFARHVQLG
jgi:hypothetical protein